MSNKTAMCMLVDDLSKLRQDILQNVESYPEDKMLRGLLLGYTNSLNKAKKLLKLEEEQMIDFGMRAGIHSARNPNQLLTDGFRDITSLFREKYK